jgi:Glycosyl hydrolase catalytic core
MLLLGTTGAASASVPHSGFGFGIADDDSLGKVSPASSIDNAGFDNLRPKIFRMQVYWDAADAAAPAGEPSWIERARAAVKRARAGGVTNVLATFTFKKDAQGNKIVPSTAQYELGIEHTITQLKVDVDVWGPCNEPNGGQAWLPNTAGAQKLASFSQSLAKAVAALDSTALRTSPDFVDRSDLGSIQSYTKAFTDAGGNWGNAAAFHPYNGVYNQSSATVANLESLTPANLPIWLTEIGGFGKGDGFPQKTQQQQDDQVKWMVYGTAGNPGLANRARVARIYYYHMRGKADPAATWDTALLNADLTPRPAWKTWCKATHNDEAAHADCAYSPPPGSAGSYIGLVGGDGSVWLKNGLPGGPWDIMGAANFAARDVEIDGNRMVVATGDGAVWLKDGLPGSTWQLMFGPEFDARDVEISGNRIAVIQGNGAVWLKDGIPGGPLLLMGASNFAARDIELDGNRLVVATGDGAVWLKDGLPGAGWGLMFGPEYNTKDVEISGNRIAVIEGNGAVWLKDGIPGGPLFLMGGTEFGGRDLALW